MTSAAIARTLGISSNFVRDLRTDPDGSKMRLRKQSYGGQCERCGGRTDGSRGPAKAPRFCARCAPAAHARRTPEALLASMREWAERFGKPPSAIQWSPAQARLYARDHPGATADRLLAIADIVVTEDWPRASTVIWRFGSFAAALRAAGFEPRPSGRPKAASSSSRSGAA